MIKFAVYLAEEAEKKLKHITHIEDHVIDSGHEGFNTAVKSLYKAKEHIESGKVNPDVTTKYDGSPSVVFGHHPETGKFFVASKSAFNKDPKINYTADDIERNHGHAPGLVDKLKAALEHLHKIAPNKGVFQGDIMHTPSDHEEHKDGSVSFKPNTIEYHAQGGDADTVKKSKIGIVAHTEYKGKDFESMAAEPLRSAGTFGHHADVHQISPLYKGDGKPMSRRDSNAIHDHIETAAKANRQIEHSVIAPHRALINTYINKTVREGSTPTTDGLRSHIVQQHQKAIDSVKTEKAKQSKKAVMNSALTDMDTNAEHFTNLLTAQHHLQQAKHILVKHMNKHFEGLAHKIDGKESNPEGYVVSHEGSLSKLVDRAEFSAANFRPRD